MGSLEKMRRAAKVIHSLWIASCGWTGPAAAISCMHRHTAALITAEDLSGLGLSPNDIRAQINTGQLRRLRRGIYVRDEVTDLELRHIRLVQATLAIIDATSVISHTSAGLLHGLPVPRSQLDRVSITRRSPGHGNFRKQLLVRRTRIDVDEITQLDNIPITSFARTAADLARTLPFQRGVMVCDAVLRSGHVERDTLFDALARHPRLHGLVRARSVMAFADGRAESPAESLSRVTMAQAGIPAPELQVELFDEAGEFIARPDFLWPELRLVGEVDGRVKYKDLLAPGETADDVVMRERRRDERLRQLGYWPMHWDFEIAGDRSALGTLIRRGMDHQARRLGLPSPSHGA